MVLLDGESLTIETLMAVARPSPARQACILYPVRCLLFIVFLLSMTTPSLSASDGWAATYGGENRTRSKANSVQQTSDGGYIVVGETTSFGAGGVDIWVLKLRPDGTVEWQKTYGGDDWDVAYSIRQTSDGGI